MSYDKTEPPVALCEGDEVSSRPWRDGQMTTDKRRYVPMIIDESVMSINDVTEKIIGCAYTISNVLGAGFLEKVYENALVHELRQQGLDVQQQYPMKIYYDKVVVGEYVAGMVVEGSVLVELKAARVLDDNHMAQCLNYLKATGMHICLLINFGNPKITVRRIINGLLIDDEQ